jgi:hypothetical protein
MSIRILGAATTTVLVSLVLAAAPAFAKTAKDCRKEWQADKAAMQAAGKTEKAYVADCSPPKAAAAKTAPVKGKEEKGGY